MVFPSGYIATSATTARDGRSSSHATRVCLRSSLVRLPRRRVGTGGAAVANGAFVRAAGKMAEAPSSPPRSVVRLLQQCLELGLETRQHAIRRRSVEDPADGLVDVLRALVVLDAEDARR